MMRINESPRIYSFVDVRIARKQLFAIAVFLLLVQLGFSQKQTTIEINFHNDNDVYLMNRQDQYYTNGVFFNMRKAVDSTRLSTSEINRIWGVTLGHQMYNAYTAHISLIEEVDRPITAYFFAAANLDRYYANERFLRMAVELGTIGQRAFGQSVQEKIHRVLNLYEISGWEYQLENAFGVDVSATYGQRLYRNRSGRFDILAQSYAALGLNHTKVALSPIFRLGKVNPIDRSAYFSGRLQSNGKPSNMELFFYFKPELNFVVYDATMQGGIFLQNKGPVTSKPSQWLLSSQFGAMYATNALTFNLQYTFNTKELPGMFFRHQYGSLGLSYRF